MLPEQTWRHIDAAFAGKDIPKDFEDIVAQINKCVEQANDQDILGYPSKTSLRSSQIIGLLKWLYEQGILTRKEQEHGH